MKKIPLLGLRTVRVGYALVDDQDYPSLSKTKWYLGATGYAVGSKGIKRMHRLVIQAPKGVGVDHLNRDKLDNRRSNLRLADQSVNGLNKGKLSSNTSGHRGVYYHKHSGLWMAKVVLRGKQLVKYFKTKGEAVRAVRKLHAEVGAISTAPSSVPKSSSSTQIPSGSA